MSEPHTPEEGDIYRNQESTRFVRFIRTQGASVLHNPYGYVDTMPSDRFHKEYAPTGMKANNIAKILNITTESMLDAIQRAHAKTPDTQGTELNAQFAYGVLEELGLNHNQKPQC